MHIGLIAPPWVPVPPPAYGGTEGVIDTLATGLTAQGHEVELVTVGESTCPVTLRWQYATPREPMGDSVIEAAHVLFAYDALSGADLIHDHTMIGPLLAPRPRRQPVVTTIHSPFTDDVRRIYAATNDTVPLICISGHQRSDAPELAVGRVIHHGVDLDRFPVGPGDGGYLLFLGRMSRDKGVHRAIPVARAAGLPLLIAAKMREASEKEYFRSEVEPLLGDGIEYVGEVAAPERLRLLRHARALINPIHWHEPFGLVMIEALACGTPVVTEAIGSAPEIVEHGTTGFLCPDAESMVDALGRIDTISRKTCRQTAATKFSAQRMVRDHIAFYEDVLAAEPPSREQPDAGLDLVGNSR
jgi:glycosyltransferase involved in cell wall biosynthesis